MEKKAEAKTQKTMDLARGGAWLVRGRVKFGRGRGKIGKERTETGFEGLSGFFVVKLIYGDLTSPLKISSRHIKIRSFAVCFGSI